MNRDPQNRDCTRDPIYVLQIGVRQWTQHPDGMGYDGESMWTEDEDLVENWIKPFLDEDGTIDFTSEFWEIAENQPNDNEWPYVYIEWRTESVFLTRDEAESFAQKREYRWDKWRVYCVPCEGELASILNQYEGAQQ